MGAVRQSVICLDGCRIIHPAQIDVPYGAKKYQGQGKNRIEIIGYGLYELV